VVYRPRGPAVHLSRPPFTAARPENGRKSTKNHLFTCFNTIVCCLCNYYPEYFSPFLSSTEVDCGILRHLQSYFPVYFIPYLSSTEVDCGI